MYSGTAALHNSLTWGHICGTYMTEQQQEFSVLPKNISAEGDPESNHEPCDSRNDWSTATNLSDNYSLPLVLGS